MPRETIVWSRCASCDAQGAGGDGRLFCPTCGGVLRSIGMVNREVIEATTNGEG